MHMFAFSMQSGPSRHLLMPVVYRLVNYDFELLYQLHKTLPGNHGKGR